MREIRTSGLMSGEGKRSFGQWLAPPRPSSNSTGEGAQDPRSGRYRRLALAGGGSLRRHSGPGRRRLGALTASASASIGSNSSGPMAATTPARSNTPSPPSRRCGWRSSNVPTTVQDLSSCRVAGLSNGPFRWFGRNRRLAKDYENLADTLAAFITLACIQLALRRLARAIDF